MPAISDWLQQAASQLQKADIASGRLDAELILAHTLRKPRTYLHTHYDDPLSARDHEIADARLQLRLDRVPVAYIIGHKEFYGRRFKVTTATLIPRSESEDIIDIVKSIIPQNVPLIERPQPQIVDVGTGSGCLGITIKLELPDTAVTLLDISRHALGVAEHNAHALKADVILRRSDLLAQYPLQADVIVANLPYVDPSWDLSPELRHEPDVALFASDDGLALIKQLIQQAPGSLRNGGYLILEADTRQHSAIASYAKRHRLLLREQRGFILSLQLTQR